MLGELTVEDMDMEIESIEMIIYEMMDIEDWAEEDDWQEDRDGDQVMPQVEFKMMTEDMEVMEATEARGGPCHHIGGGRLLIKQIPGHVEIQARTNPEETKHPVKIKTSNLETTQYPQK